MSHELGCIYLFRNLIDGKGYVGQHVGPSPEKRWKQHFNAAFLKKLNRPLYNAIRRDGWDAFSREVIWHCPITSLDTWETHFIAVHNTFLDNGRGYNLTTGGGNGRHWSEISKAKLSVSAKLGAQIRWSRPEERERMSASTTARFKDPAQRKACSLANKKRFEDPEQRRMTAEKQTGKKASDLTKSKMSAAHKLRYEDPAECAKTSAANKLRYESPAARQVTADATKRRYEDPEERRKTGETTAAQWRNPEGREKRLTALHAVMATPEYKRNLSEGNKRGWTEERRAVASEARRQFYRDNPEEVKKMALAVKLGKARKRAEREATLV